MKLRRIPEIDLARFATKGEKEQKSALRSYDAGGGGWSYDPARSQCFNIFNPTTRLGLEVARPSIEKILQEVTKACRDEAQKQSCVEVTRLLWEWVQSEAGKAIERPIPSMALGSIGAVRYWGNFAVQYNGRPHFVFFDHRRSNGLTGTARQFAFSMMREQLIATDIEFADAGLLILQFPQPKKSDRIIRAYTDEGMELFDLYTLQDMVANTYRIWAEVLEEKRRTDTRRAAGE